MEIKKAFPFRSALSAAYETYINHLKFFFILSLSLFCILVGISAFLELATIAIAYLINPSVSPEVLSILRGRVSLEVVKELLTNGIPNSIFHFYPLMATIFSIRGIVYFFVNILYEYLIIRFALELQQGRTLSLTQLLPREKQSFFSFLKARFIFNVRVALGLLLCFVPAGYWASKYFFVGFPLMEDPMLNTSEDSAIAVELSHSHKWRLFLVALLFSLSSSLGMFLSSIFFFPLCVLTQTYLYLKLRYAEEADRNRY